VGSKILPGARNDYLRLLFLGVVAVLGFEVVLRGLGLA